MGGPAIPVEVRGEVTAMYQAGYPGWKVAKKFSVGTGSVFRVLREQGGLSRGRLGGFPTYHYNSDCFSSIDTEEKAYWLGFIAADGCVSVQPRRKVLSIAVAAQDQAHLRKIESFLGMDVYVKLSRSLGKRQDYVRISMYSSKVVDDLVGLGITPRKSLTLSWPDLTPSLYPHFIRGYNDGDGCFYRYGARRGRSYIGVQIACSIPFAGACVNYLYGVGHDGWRIVRRGNICVLTLNQQMKVWAFVNYLYQNSSLFLERKRAIVEHFIGRSCPLDRRKTNVF